MVVVFATMSFACLAQDQSLQFIENKLVAYRDKTLQEKLFVHTDKKTYLAGEFLWFKLYYVEGYTHHPLTLSRLAYLELLNADNQPVSQAKVSLKAGEEDGSLYLPLNLPTGNYKLRAYTNWMKNFAPEFFFEKEVSIINPLSSSKAQSKTSTENANDITFFPEGGNLVNGLTSVLAFKGNNIYGRGVPFKGWILDEKNDTVTTFSPFKFGMGNVSFTPAAGHVYKASVLFADGKRIKKDLPQIQDNGYVMHLQKINASQIKIDVKTISSSATGEIFLIAHTREIIQVADQATFNNGAAVFLVDASRLALGVTQFTLFDSHRRPVAERLYFTPPQSTWKADVQTDRNEYASREKINLSLRTIDSKGAQVPANLSLSIFRLDSVQIPDNINIENYFLLTSDLAGSVESPAYYFGEPTVEREQATDNLMLTQGWRRFRWQNVLADKETFVASHPPEINGPLLTANVYAVQSNQPVSGLQTFASLPGKRYQVHFAQSNSAGQVQFELKDYYGPGEIMIKPFSDDDSLYRIELQNPFSEQYATTPITPLLLHKEQEKRVNNYSIGMQVRQVYAGDSLNRFNPPQPLDSFSFLGFPDYTYNLDDYTRFTTMEEVLREYVRPITVGVQKGRPHMVFVNETSRTTHDNNVLVMLDGVPLHNQDRLFTYDPLKIKKLEIFPRPYVIGPNYFFGVANFSTYKGEFDGFELDPHLIAIDYQGLQMQREFYVPVYETPAQKASRLPDYRNTLYWNPNISTSVTGNTSLSFFSCDQKGRYLGVVQGMGTDGQVLAQEFMFDVK